MIFFWVLVSIFRLLDFRVGISGLRDDYKEETEDREAKCFSSLYFKLSFFNLLYLLYLLVFFSFLVDSDYVAITFLPRDFSYFCLRLC